MVGPIRCLGAVLLVACQVHVGQAAEKPFAVLAADGKAPVSYTHLTLPTSDLV